MVKKSFVSFSAKIHSFEVQCPNVTNNSFLCKDDIQGRNYKIKRYGKFNYKHCVSCILFPAKNNCLICKADI